MQPILSPSKAKQRDYRPSSQVGPGHTLGKYEIIEQIGQGAMASVFLARDTLTERKLAVKVANPDSQGNEKRNRLTAKLFFNEAKAAGMLAHPNIVAVHDAGIQDEVRYIVMEYVPGGRTLKEYCRTDDLLPIETAVKIMLDCAIAFDYAHRKGVIHRDIKPKNIFLTREDEVKIGDFGVALVTGMDVAETQVTGHLGSPLYMAPEQVRGDTITSQADLFSLGAVMYELLTGVHPFAAGNLEAITRRITREPHTPVHELRPGVPRVLSRVIDRTLKKHPAGRYSMGLDLAGDLSLIFDDLSHSAPQVGAQRRFDEARVLAFFQAFDDGELWEVVNAGAWREFEAGRCVLEPGEQTDSFFVVVRGELRVERDASEVERLFAGSCFGELGTVQRAEHAACVVAETDAAVLQVRRNVLERATNCRDPLQRAIIDAAVSRLARATRPVER